MISAKQHHASNEDLTHYHSEITGKYAEAGQFDQALETAATLENEASKTGALTEIAGMYAEAGQKEKSAQLLSQALAKAATMGDEELKARALVMIAGKYVETGQKPSQKDMAQLSKIVHMTYPLKSFWE